LHPHGTQISKTIIKKRRNVLNERNHGNMATYALLKMLSLSRNLN
jgi:hypothetical protein